MIYEENDAFKSRNVKDIIDQEIKFATSFLDTQANQFHVFIPKEEIDVPNSMFDPKPEVCTMKTIDLA